MFTLGEGGLARSEFVGIPVAFDTREGERSESLAVEREFERTRSRTVRNVGFDIVFAILGNINGVFEPFVLGRVTDSLAGTATNDIYRSVVLAAVFMVAIFTRGPLRSGVGNAVVAFVEVFSFNRTRDSDSLATERLTRNFLFRLRRLSPEG